MKAEKPVMINELLSIKEIVNERLFKIPDYQRGYSWETDQLEDLIKDIEHISSRNHKHYTGTLVITKSQENGRFHIVDGQQRLTTLIILFKVIEDRFPNKYKKLKEEFILRSQEYVLETNLETNRYFRDAILGDNKSLPVEIKSFENLKNAKEFFQRWIKKNEDRIDLIYDTLTNKLGFICFSPNNTEEIGIMFEVINNRGKALSELEKIKNYFIYYSTIHDQKQLKVKINETWGNILQYLNKARITSNDDENRFLRNCYIVFYSSDKSKSWAVYDQLKEKYPPDDLKSLPKKINKISEFIDFVLICAQSYSYFSRGDVFDSEYTGPSKSRLKTILSRLRCHPVNASIFPIYLAVMSQLRVEEENPAKVAKILDVLEILNFRVYVLPNSKVSRADSKQGDLFWWANEFYKFLNWKSEDYEIEKTTYGGREVDGDIYDWLRLNLVDFTKAMCPEEIIIKSLTIDESESIDYYGWNGLRYLLARYEEHLCLRNKESWPIERILVKREETSKDKGNDYLSIEHIWASKNRKNDFPPDFKDKRRLGNFALIGLLSNIQLTKDDIADKVKFLKENARYSMIQINELSDYLKEAIEFAKKRRTKRTKYFYSDIAIHLIDHRETELIRFALDTWKLPGERMNKFDHVNSFRAWDEKRSSNYFLKSDGEE
jgi:hypothetical protein